MKPLTLLPVLIGEERILAWIWDCWLALLSLLPSSLSSSCTNLLNPLQARFRDKGGRESFQMKLADAGSRYLSSADSFPWVTPYQRNALGQLC